MHREYIAPKWQVRLQSTAAAGRAFHARMPGCQATPPSAAHCAVIAHAPAGPWSRDSVGAHSPASAGPHRPPALACRPLCVAETTDCPAASVPASRAVSCTANLCFQEEYGRGYESFTLAIPASSSVAEVHGFHPEGPKQSAMSRLLFMMGFLTQHMRPTGLTIGPVRFPEGLHSSLPEADKGSFCR